MKEQQTFRVLIEVFKPEIGNGFQQRNTDVHCKAHTLGLAIVHSSSDVSARTMMGTV